ncbi:Lovastatin diketide synthase LovF 17 [Colletotrichum chlorophyti]|uniref:Lovastatin diketide synthase LovF 17 n=1 Tax=Colletotrichum chlorophyti TaxID=708187 RepID=A0A1Q8RS53_9PEZI|nr:Lovastatin diketide synthase LovF 17 [Colletotrichum chlorophyti]
MDTSAQTSYTSPASEASDDGLLLNGLRDDGMTYGTTPSHRTQVPIAVVGMGCRLPGHSNSPTALWDFLQRGGVAKNEPPSSRFSLNGHYDKSKRPRTMKSPGGMFIEDVDPELFDGQFFNISRVDCVAMDPQQRQLLEVAYECLENAGIPLEVLSGTKTGVIVGTNFIDYGAIQNRDPEDRADSITIGLASSILSNRISHFLNVTGPSMTIDTACSASLVSVDVACRYLDSFQADGMLVGGANMWLTPEHNEEVGMMNITQSGSGRCHSFDAKADGYVKAEGINVVYLKRLDDAIRDKDPIRAVIRGTAANASGRTAGIANPSPDAQAAVTRMAYKNAGISDFRATQFLECHGTGTLAGDPVEVKGAASVFAAGRQPGQELVIGSIKSNIGHSEAAAGLSGLLKAIMAVERGVIPGNPTFLDPNPNIDWKASRVRASRTSVKWPAHSIVRRASVNSFGFGGANAHAVVENNAVSLHHESSYKQVTTNFFDDDEDDEEDDVINGDQAHEMTTPKLLVFSANDQASLQSYVKRLSSHLLNPMVSIELNDLAYTLSERRTKHYYRAFDLTRSNKAKVGVDSLIQGKQASSPPRVGFVFTGQGAQWSQMGAELLKSHPLAKSVIRNLDDVLQSLPEPPKWSLLAELTEERSAKELSQPEFSQPLVTALQLALLAVLDDWGIRPKAVVGHSSGEIAAATAAGLITPAAAIKTAYFRGQAAKKVGPTAEPVGMLAVGVGADLVNQYLRPDEGKVQIACYNSPSSLTISGPVAALEKLRDRLKNGGHFARLLLVDLAYHSDYMTEIGAVYEQMLISHDAFDKNQAADESTEKARMFSSVTGKALSPSERPDAAYWKRNMVSPVQFDQAATELLRDTKDGADFLIELGPSNALSGPLAQIKKKLASSPGADAPYTSALKRGADSTLALYNAAGQLFLTGGSVDLSKVNRVDTNKAKVIVDLPNYSWNHSTRYWHETLASKDWRFKKFINHDLLGSKVLGTAWQTPVFKKVLKLADLPWLKDHKLGSEVVFPAAGYVAMAAEAAYQTAMVTQWDEQAPARYRIRLRDVKLLRALVLEEKSETRLTLTLSPVKGGSTRSWYEFRVSSIQDGLSVHPVHSAGLVCVETDYQDSSADAPAEAVRPLDLATSAQLWYKALADRGYNFGPAFQKHLMVESTLGQRKSRSTVNLEPPPTSSNRGQSDYPLHPAVMDACFQTASPALWKGDLPTADAAALVPKIIDSIVIEAGSSHHLPDEGLALASANYLGVGDTENPRNYATSVELYDPKDGKLLFEMKGLASGEIETSDQEQVGHTVMRAEWNADVNILLDAADTPVVQQWLETKTVQESLDIVAHKKPGLSVLELNLGSDDDSSLWLEQGTEGSIKPMRAACSQYHIALREAKVLVGAQERLASHASNPQFHLVDVAKPAAVATDTKFDLVIVKMGPQSETNVEETILNQEIVLQSLATTMQKGGVVVAHGISETALGHLGKTAALRRDGDGAWHICRLKETEEKENYTDKKSIAHVSLLGAAAEQTSNVAGVIDALAAKGLILESSDKPLKVTASKTDIVVVLDELFVSLTDRIDEQQWEILKHIITKERLPVLWVTSGAHLNVTDPTKALITGLLRTIRAEEDLRLVTLDVENPEADATADAIVACLKELRSPSGSKTKPGDKSNEPLDSEFVERGGIVRISRLLPDTDLTVLQSDQLSSRPTETADLHAHEVPVQLRCERLGNIDTINFGEVAVGDSSPSDELVEVEVYAAGMNYKDVVVTMGIVPGDETALGHEAAGIVTRIAPNSSGGFAVGDRVVVFGKGCFANRVQTTPSRVHRIPDSLTLEEAATLPVVYLTAFYSLIDIGNLSAGQRVLIHSAAGGVGIAAVQLAQQVGAEVFVTVGSQEKREFIKSAFGLSDDHIYNSRNTSFASGILAATGGRGVDVVLNSLTGDLLDESFRILADGGTMVEIGKKDILDRNSLPLAPFDRSLSFRAVDLSPERATDALVSRLFSKVFELFEAGLIKPINPIHKFSWTDIPSAIRFLRPGTHIGKVVLSSGSPDTRVQVPIRKAPKQLRFRDDGTYLIVGGLRGLCGSLAIYLAKSGAKQLAVISRSGYADDKSRSVVKQLKALGAHIDLLTADITVEEEVENALRQTTVPVAGIIQGAMVLRDRPFDSMTLSEYHEAVQCKIGGTWNLHKAAEALNLDLDFFTLLSSISGVVGNRGQANYAAANVFLDNFAAYRRNRGQPACAVDLGVIEDSGVIAENAKLQNQFDSRVYRGINDALLRKILHLSLLQQQEAPAPSPAAGAQIITGLIAQQPADSSLNRDARFSALFTKQGGGGSGSGDNSGGSGNAEMRALLLLLRSESADPAAKLKATVEVVSGCFARLLRLSEPMDPARPLSVYGIDSLAAVEVRNWVRTELGALVTTLDIMNAASLTTFSGKVIAKLATGAGEENSA